MSKIETELKLELSESEFEKSQQILKEKGFKIKKESHLSDYFFNVRKFDAKGYDFTRIRVYNESEYERTDKAWKMVNGDRVREETEGPSSPEELDEFKATEPNFLTNTKYRTDFEVQFNNESALVSFDKVIFPDETRYFVELEVNVPEEQSTAIRPELKKWLLNTFNLSDREEGIGMMRLVLSKVVEK